MKLSNFLSTAALLATTLASEDPDPSPASELASESSPSAADADPSPWASLWTPSSLSAYTTPCRASTTFKTEIYTLAEMYPTLKTWAPELKVFYNKVEYPGSWDGVDLHGEKRELLKMQLADVPEGVRTWLREHEFQRRYSVQGDVVFFAPGAMYPLLPLWVDEPGNSVCEGAFEDLENYGRELTDGGVVASVSHRSSGKNEVEITIEAMLLKLKEEKDKHAELKDEL
ncbi:hypothetical protein BU16DRAFT_333872 [Lophium mytilinum]|uniref:Uncharacterized protein n=1 Tax=Lophium mytilinum TaxID=390894 RepID=A0A6A6R2C6_9PEZI|nr:hypothetical protein BU16DRAFT_333872 [Lophium mytilinum]